MWSRSAISRRGRLLTATFGAAYLPRYRRLGWWRLIAGINQGLANAVGGFDSVEVAGRCWSGGSRRLVAADGGVVVVVGVSDVGEGFE